MRASVDIENSHLGYVITLNLKILEYVEDKKIIFDISPLTKNELEILKLAVSNDKDTEYTDIELFFIDDNNSPELGVDYDFYIENNQLIGIYNR